MANEPLPSAQSAFSKEQKSNGVPLARLSSFVCPYCRVYAVHQWGAPRDLDVPVSGGSLKRVISGDPKIVFARCEGCRKETIFVDGVVRWPRLISAPPPAADLPAPLLRDYEEARRIHTDSPRGAAALLRLTLQNLCPFIGSTKTDINEAIKELVALQKVTPSLQQALDTVRVVGNEAVHPGELNLKDDHETVTKLFRLINFIVEKTITEPTQIAELYGSLPPKKLEGIANRDNPKAK